MLDRGLLDELLTAAERETVAAVCGAANVPLSRWHDSPNLARPFLLLAWARLADRIQAQEDASLTAARETAAIQLGLEIETMKSWRKRWRRDAYRGAEQKVRSAPQPAPAPALR